MEKRMDGETYGSVMNFCNLGDNLDRDGREDLAATTRIRNGWMKFREIMPFLTSRDAPLEMKGQVYASCIRRSMIYGNETRFLLVDVGLQFKRADYKMDVCCFHEKNRKTSEKNSEHRVNKCME